MVICLKRGADLHVAQLMPLPLTISCSSKIQIGFTFMVLAHLGSPGQRAIKRMCVCVCVLTVSRISCTLSAWGGFLTGQQINRITNTPSMCGIKTSVL